MPLDLDLERRSVADPSLPWGWNLWPLLQSGFDVRIDSPQEGEPPALLITSEEESSGFGLYRIVGVAAGRQVSFSATIEIERGSRAGVAIQARRIVDGNFVVVAADSADGIPGPSSARIEATVDVPRDADMIDLLITASGRGVRALRELRLEIDGVAGGAFEGVGPTPSAEAAWLRDRGFDWGDPAALPSGPAPGLEGVVRNARIVLLGESTHGTSEFFLLKHRITRRLLAHDGAVVVALEDHMSTVGQLQELLVTSSGDAPIDLPAGMFSIWDREEVYEFLEWARPMVAEGRLELWGVDVQNPLPAAAQVVQWLRGFAADSAELADMLYGPVREAMRTNAWRGQEPRVYDTWRSAALRVEAMVEGAGDGGAVSAPGSEAGQSRALVERLAHTVTQWVDFAEAPGSAARDSLMAENLEWLRGARPDRRIVFWGHNGHVRLSPGGVGAFLREAVGADVLSIGFLTYAGTYTATWPVDGRWQLGTYALFPAPPGTVEHALHQTGIRVGLWDLRDLPEDGLGSWLQLPRQARSIGATPVDYGFGPTKITTTFDALVFVDRSTAAKPRE